MKTIFSVSFSLLIFLLAPLCFAQEAGAFHGSVSATSSNNNPTSVKQPSTSSALTGASRVGRNLNDSVVAQPHVIVIANRDLYKYTHPRRTGAPDGTLEVIWFFWYGSPWSARTSEDLHAWANSRAYNIQFTPFPVIFPDSTGASRQVQIIGARVFFALRKLGHANGLSPLFLQAVHDGYVSLSDMSSILSWMEAHGVSKKSFLKAINSRAVKQNTANVPFVITNYFGDTPVSTPTVVIDGTYVAKAHSEGDLSRWLGVVETTVDHLAKTAKRP